MAYAPLLPRETRLNVMRHDLVDHPLLAKGLDGDTGADITPWLLSVVSEDNVNRMRTSVDTLKARILETIADEETELLDEDLLDLIAAGQQ